MKNCQEGNRLISYYIFFTVLCANLECSDDDIVQINDEEDTVPRHVFGDKIYGWLVVLIIVNCV